MGHFVWSVIIARMHALLEPLTLGEFQIDSSLATTGKFLVQQMLQQAT
jgi:hypothetical protein